MSSKKLSGAQRRKRDRELKEETKIASRFMSKYLKKSETELDKDLSSDVNPTVAASETECCSNEEDFTDETSATGCFPAEIESQLSQDSQLSEDDSNADQMANVQQLIVPVTTEGEADHEDSHGVNGADGSSTVHTSAIFLLIHFVKNQLTLEKRNVKSWMLKLTEGSDGRNV